jgi:Family of unknown function (DUF6252)
MKKILFILVVVALFSCDDNVEFNKSTMQGKINNSFWKAVNIQAVKGSGNSISITGATGLNDVILNVSNLAPGKYDLGTTNNGNRALYVSYKDNSLEEYTTAVAPGPVALSAIQSPGTGYETGIAKLTTFSGTSGGTGLKVDITVDAAGAITSVKVNTPGSGYKAGDVVKVTGGDENGFVRIVNTSNSNGEIVIEEFEGGSITGTFKFTAFNPANSKTTVAREGIFYKVPVK